MKKEEINLQKEFLKLDIKNTQDRIKRLDIDIQGKAIKLSQLVKRKNQLIQKLRKMKYGN